MHTFVNSWTDIYLHENFYGTTYVKPFFPAPFASKGMFKNISGSKLSFKLYDCITAKRIHASN